MSIEERSCRVDQGVLLIVSLHQNGIEGGDAAFAELARALDEPRQQGKNRRRIAL